MLSKYPVISQIVFQSVPGDCNIRTSSCTSQLCSPEYIQSLHFVRWIFEYIVAGSEVATYLFKFKGPKSIYKTIFYALSYFECFILLYINCFSLISTQFCFSFLFILCFLFRFFINYASQIFRTNLIFDNLPQCKTVL